MRRLLVGFLYVLVAAFFAWAGFMKIRDPASFVSSLLTYELFSIGLARWIAVYVPVLEVVLALCLISGYWRRGAVWLSGVLIWVFIAVVAQAQMRGLVIDCGCFGSNRLESSMEYAWKIGQNILLWAALWAAAALDRRRNVVFSTRLRKES